MKFLTTRVLFSENCRVGACLAIEGRRYCAQPSDCQLVKEDAEAQLC